MSTGYAISGRTGVITTVEVPDHPHHELVLGRPTPPPPAPIGRYPGRYLSPLEPLTDPALLTVDPLTQPVWRAARRPHHRSLLVVALSLLVAGGVW